MVLHTLYYFGTQLHNIQEIYNIGKFTVQTYKAFPYHKSTVYSIQDEIWQIVELTDLCIFDDFICV